MTAPSPPHATIPPPIQQSLDAFAARLAESLGGELVAVVLYGSLVRGDFVAGKSDANVLVVVGRISVAVLDNVGGALNAAGAGVRVSPLVMTEADLCSSTDVFPIKFLDMQRRHLLLAGRDVLADLHIADDHLRLRCEQELKNLMLRLRRFYLNRRHRPELVEATLVRGAASLLNALRVLLELRGHPPAVRYGEVAAAAAQAFGLDGDLLRALLEVRAGSSQPDRGRLLEMYDRFMPLVERAASLADEHPG